MSPLKLFALKQATPGHTGIGLWRNPRSRSHEYNSLRYLAGLAKQLEAGGFDGVFFADALGALDTYQGSAAAGLRDGIGTPAGDPVPGIAAMAAVTTTLDFAVTISTTYTQPYLLARTLGTLDQLTEGRIGWNVVTSALESGARNLGIGALPPHDERYDRADEFLDAAYSLWEGSWADDAVVRDAAAGSYVDPDRVRPVGFAGRYFSVPDVSPVEPSPQRTPVIFQAGTSGRGLEFAGSHAEGVFVSAYSAKLVGAQVQRGRRALEAAGRAGTDAVFLANATFIVAESDAEAQAVYAHEYLAYVSTEGALARYSALLGIDLSAYPQDEPLVADSSGGIQGLVDIFLRMDPTRAWTPRAIGEFVAIGGGGPVFVGSPATVADGIEAFVAESGIDGFNVTDPLPGVTLDAVCALLIPELRRRGMVGAASAEESGSTFRQRLHGTESARLQAPHPAAIVRARYWPEG